MKRILVVMALIASGSAGAIDCISPTVDIGAEVCERMAAVLKSDLIGMRCDQVYSIWKDTGTPLARVTCVNGHDARGLNIIVSYALGAVAPTLIASEDQWKAIYSQVHRALFPASF